MSVLIANGFVLGAVLQDEQPLLAVVPAAVGLAAAAGLFCGLAYVVTTRRSTNPIGWVLYFGLAGLARGFPVHPDRPARLPMADR